MLIFQGVRKVKCTLPKFNMVHLKPLMGTPSSESPGFSTPGADPIFRWVPMFNFRGVYELRKEGKKFSRSKSLLPNIDYLLPSQNRSPKKIQELRGQVSESMASAISEFVGKDGRRFTEDWFFKNKSSQKNNMLWLLWLKYFFGIKTEISCLFWMSFLLWNWIAELWKPKQPGEWDGTQVVTRDTILFSWLGTETWSQATTWRLTVFFASILRGHYGTACRCEEYGKGFLPVIYPLVRQPMTPSQLVHGL